MYLVTAYRWGWTNSHQYQVYCGPDRTKAHALAQAEVADRANKYGCAVSKWNDDGTEQALEEYYASRDEKLPNHNFRMDMFKHLGHVMVDFARGMVSLPDPDKPGFLKPVEVVPPQWLVDVVAREEAMVEKLEHS